MIDFFEKNQLSVTAKKITPKMATKRKRPTAKLKSTITPELEEKYCGRYVQTPLSFWDDGKCVAPKRKKIQMILGLITRLKQTKKTKNKITAVVHYAPYDDEPESICELFLHVIDKMILPPDFEPEFGTFFNDETESEGSEQFREKCIKKRKINFEKK